MTILHFTIMHKRHKRPTTSESVREWQTAVQAVTRSSWKSRSGCGWWSPFTAGPNALPPLSPSVSPPPPLSLSLSLPPSPSLSFPRRTPAAGDESQPLLELKLPSQQRRSVFSLLHPLRLLRARSGEKPNAAPPSDTNQRARYHDAPKIWALACTSLCESAMWLCPRGLSGVYRLDRPSETCASSGPVCHLCPAFHALVSVWWCHYFFRMDLRVAAAAAAATDAASHLSKWEDSLCKCASTDSQTLDRCLCSWWTKFKLTSSSANLCHLWLTMWWTLVWHREERDRESNPELQLNYYHMNFSSADKNFVDWSRLCGSALGVSRISLGLFVQNPRQIRVERMRKRTRCSAFSPSVTADAR